MTAAQEPPDSAELDALVELQRHAGYLLVRERIIVELERRRVALENHTDAFETAWARGMIAALRMCLGIPEILRSEIKSELEER